MESQIALLRAMASGDEPVTPENLRAAFNRDVLTERAVVRQTESVEATLRALNTESDKLQAMIARREMHLARVNAELERLAGPEARSPSIDLEKLKHPVNRLAEGHLSELGLGEPREIVQVLWRLLEVTARNEQLLVPSDSRIVQFLLDERLLRSEPAGGSQVRVRLF